MDYSDLTDSTSDDQKEWMEEEKKQPETVENIAQQEIERSRAKVQEIESSDFMDFSLLVPKKPTWDLQQHIEPKLTKLEKRTQKAIVDMIRQRLLNKDNK